MKYLEAINAALEGYIAACDVPKVMREAMAYSVFAGGKRLRPRMCLSAAELAGGSMEDAMPIACALEMIHTYSLIHDDLPCMDDDDFRRGRPSNHKVYGEANALLAGDGLLSLAFETILREGQERLRTAPRYYEAALEVARGAGVSGMVAGQWADLANEENPAADADALAYIHRRKTGALITAAMVSGAVAGNADAKLIDALRCYGEHYGILFQITDDILDVVGDAKTVGKTLGKDAAQNKLTYPALYGLEEARRMAEKEAELAIAALLPFGEKAAWFTELAQAALTRTY
ncbi:MAG: polyprenyl synthetase family protein [Clostridiales bacterium]|nr:polyprenyl synthetase family protein [Clostridiales bacterium]